MILGDLSSAWLWQLDGWIIVAGVLCAIAASLVGNFLVLRRLSMLGDAVSHAVLPGLAAAFLISGSRQSLPMFVGAAIVGVLTAMLTQWIRNFGKVDEGASMGVVFTTLFAIGLIIIVQAADRVDLDPGCVLYGAIEFTPLDTVMLAGVAVPQVVITLAIVTVVNLLFVLICFKELKLTSFDAALADTMGLRSSWIHYLLMTLVAITAVASFESVGNILVVAMLIVPGATASLLTDRLPRLIVISALLGALAAVAGHLTAITVPRWFGYSSTSTSGMMALMSGFIFVVALFFGPSNGLLFVMIRRLRLAWVILGDDILAYLYRQEERLSTGQVETAAVKSSWLQHQLLASRFSITVVTRWYRLIGLLSKESAGLRLTEQGRRAAVSLVRSHRLWEQYLVDQANVPSDRIHGQAEQLEHFTNRSVRKELERETLFPSSDPHGSPIPTEDGTNHAMRSQPKR